MKVWPIDPLVPRNLRLEVPEKLPQGLNHSLYPSRVKLASQPFLLLNSCKKLTGLLHIRREFLRSAPPEIPIYSNNIQLSSGGANKFAVLAEVVLWSDGRHLPAGEQCSHLCDEPACKNAAHIITESVAANNSRKGCPGVEACVPSCSRCSGSQYILGCRHRVPCIKKAVAAYADHNDLLARGLCWRKGPSGDWVRPEDLES
jgi:hypothetical protein